jgi:superfamily I DNA/RNA helicase
MLEGLHHIVPECEMVRQVLESTSDLETKVGQLTTIGLAVNDSLQLTHEFERSTISAEGLRRIEHEQEEEAELAERNVQEMSAVELLTIVSSKGLSADHVIIIGFDNVNMKWVTRNAFYVALTRARKSLHIVTSLKSGGSSAPHGFIDQLPEKHVQFGWYNKKDRKIKSFAARGLFVNYLAWFQKNVVQRQPAKKKTGR